MEAEIKFEPEGRSGVIATGSYLLDAAKRLGVKIPECERRGETDSCAVEIVSGKNLLSEPTKAELETLDAERLIKGERLACQAKVVSAGEIVVKVEEKETTAEEKQETKERKKVEDFRKQFDDMPLEKKVATLLELEAVALSETFSFVLNSPYHIIGKVMDVLAEFGLKMEKDDKNAKRPAEHKSDEDAENSTNGKKKTKNKKSKNEESNDAAAEAEVAAVETQENDDSAGENARGGDAAGNSKDEDEKK